MPSQFKKKRSLPGAASSDSSEDEACDTDENDEDQGAPASSSKSRLKGFGGKFRFFTIKRKPDASSEAAYKKLLAKVTSLENEKAVAQAKMDQLLLEMSKETEAAVKEREKLQTEITQLRLTTEDLMTQLEKAKQDLEDATEKRNILSSIEMCQVRGWLWKRGVVGPTGRIWRRRWFTTQNDGRLYYYHKHNQRIPRGFLDVLKITEVQDLASSEENEAISCFNIVTPTRTYEIKAKDKDEKLRWLKALDLLMYWTNRQAACDEGQLSSTENFG